MKCKRLNTRKEPDVFTRLKLFAHSAGYCQNPACMRELFLEVGDDEIHVAEMSHIIAASADGPRGTVGPSDDDLAQYENLILLCPTCHTIIDKAPAEYPDAAVRSWKLTHDERRAQLFGFVGYDDRAAARAEIEPLLAQNHAIWTEYGPETDEQFNPESELPPKWRRKLVEVVFPNNRRMLGILDANRHLMDDGELQTLETFRQHVDDLEARHLEGEAGGSRFPTEMNDMLR